MSKTTSKGLVQRALFVFLLFCIGGIAIIGKAILIQVNEGQELLAKSEKLRSKYRTIPAERGSIYAEDGDVLASSMPFFELRFDVLANGISSKDFKENVDTLATLMASYLKQKSKKEYKNLLLRARANNNRYLLIKRNASYNDLKEIQSWPLLNRGRNKGGLIVVEDNKRVNPFGLLGRRTIGYAQTDDSGNVYGVGLERKYNNDLKGKDGQRLMQKVSNSTWVPVNRENEVKPENGNDLTTTLDVNIQDVAEDALMNSLERFQAEHGSVVVIEVNTGEIKALANLGKRNSDGEYHEIYNYTVGEANEPGSTFKLATMLSLLEDGKISITDEVDLEGGKTTIYGQEIKDSENHGKTKVSIKESFAISSNVAMAKLANRFYSQNPSDYINKLKQFRLDKQTGISIPGEAEPFINQPKSETWTATSIPYMSFGYQVELTPLQVAAFYNAIANDGEWIQPYLTKEISDFGKPIKDLRPKKSTRICTKENARTCKELLLSAVEEGTGRGIYNGLYSIAGKTGTAQIARGKQGYDKKNYLSSFAGFFPYENPKYTIVITIYSPSSGEYYASKVAGPVFREISDRLYANKFPNPINQEGSLAEGIKEMPKDNQFRGFNKDLSTVFNYLDFEYIGTENSDWVKTRYKEDKLSLAPISLADQKVPDVRGMGLRDAIYLLEKCNLRIGFSGRGKVTKQSLDPGSRIGNNKKIYITLE